MQIIGLIIAVIPKPAVFAVTAHRKPALQPADGLHGNPLSRPGQYFYGDLSQRAVFGVIQLIPVAHGQSVDQGVNGSDAGSLNLALGQIILYEQIHPQMVQTPFIVLHLGTILMGLAVQIQDPWGEIVKCLSPCQLVRFQKLHVFWQFLPDHFRESFIVLPGKGHIRVVIPGNKPLMPHRPQESPGIYHVGDLVFSAYPVDLFEDLQISPMDRSKVVGSQGSL